MDRKMGSNIGQFACPEENTIAQLEKGHFLLYAT
jgi:hypothetical protein